MQRYLILILTASLLLPLLVVPNAVVARRLNKVPVAPIVPRSSGADRDLFQGPNVPQGQTGPVVSRAIRFAESLPVTSLPPEMPALGKDASIKFNGEGREIENETEIRKAVAGREPSIDGALQEFSTSFARVATAPPTPSLTFNGLTNRDNNSLFAYEVFPPDANGDVGPNHYVQAVNITFRVFDKSGNPLTAPAKLSSLFDPLGWPCGNRDDGDPIVQYDQMADRWMLSQFCIQKSPDLLPPFHQLIAVSKTGDPTGSYYLYDFIMPGSNFNDYPKFGVWPDAYYMTDNQFYLYSGLEIFDGTGAFAFDRRKMLAGDPSASFIYFNLNLASHPEAIGGMLPADADGLNPPPQGAPCPFAYFTADEFGDAGDGLRIFDFHADFAAPTKSTFKERPESAAYPRRGIEVAAFNPNSPIGIDDIPQPPAYTSDSLDSISDRLMYRLQYRNFGDHESLVVNHTVDVNPNAGFRAGVRYYELRKQPGSNPYKVNEQATFAGASSADTTHRWMGSAAMNAAGDLAVAYSVSSTHVYPSLRYAARLQSDTPGGLRQGEQTIFAGTSIQSNSGSRWGDYSSLSVDPTDDCTFWFTGETYVDGLPSLYGIDWITKISKFSLRPCAPLKQGAIQGSVINAATGLPIPNATIVTPNGYLRATDATGSYSMSPVVPNTYAMTASAPGFSSVNVSGVTVADGDTVTQNFVLVPINIIAAAGAKIVSESIPDGVLDPGETVTVNLSLKNIGGQGASTSNLVANLKAMGGVTSPSGPQTYGAVAVGASSVSMPFTFKVDPNFPCGGTLTATLALHDGTATYRAITYQFQTSKVEVPYTGAPVWIPDRASVNIPFKVSGIPGRILDLDFKVGGTYCTTELYAPTVGIDDTFVAELTIKLKSPHGTVVTLLDNINADNNFPNICQTLLDDDAFTRPSIQDVEPWDAPFVGTYRPASPLSAFDGEDPNGTWVLMVTDHWDAWNGYVRAFSVIITTHQCTEASQSISGQVKVGTTSLSGATMTLTSPDQAGFAPRIVQTDSNGRYSFTNLPPAHNYTLTPTKTNYNFTPASKSYTYLNASQINQNFAATLKTYSMSGQVTKAGTTTGIARVTLKITSPLPAGFTPRSVLTNSTGNYIFTNLPGGRNYTITPTLSGFTFDPTTRSITNLSANQAAGPATSFTGTQ